MQPGYETTWPLFLGIIAVYVVVSLLIGGKKTYFEPYEEPAETTDKK
jgi:hypothetical protein